MGKIYDGRGDEQVNDRTFLRGKICEAAEAMKKLKFSGREMAVLRAIDFSNGTSGGGIIERTNIAPEETLDILHGLMETGFVETNPFSQSVELFALFETKFEVNPSYAHDLKEALLRR